MLPLLFFCVALVLATACTGWAIRKRYWVLCLYPARPWECWARRIGDELAVGVGLFLQSLTVWPELRQIWRILCH